MSVEVLVGYAKVAWEFPAFVTPVFLTDETMWMQAEEVDGRILRDVMGESEVDQLPATRVNFDAERERYYGFAITPSEVRFGKRRELREYFKRNAAFFECSLLTRSHIEAFLGDELAAQAAREKFAMAILAACPEMNRLWVNVPGIRPEDAPSGQLPEFRKTSVYIVDGHALVRRGLIAVINGESDLEVIGQAEDSSTALKEIIKHQPDIVTVEISLKGNSGLELIKGIRAFNPKIKILVLSMHHESIYALRVLKAGARAYVMKHDVIAKVIEAIRRIRGGDLYVSDDVASQMLTRLVGPEADRETSPVAMLSDRELEVTTLIGNGFDTREIAAKLHVSVKTIETHRARIKGKLNLRNATQLVQFCSRWVEEREPRSDMISRETASLF